MWLQRMWSLLIPSSAGNHPRCCTHRTIFYSFGARAMVGEDETSHHCSLESHGGCVGANAPLSQPAFIRSVITCFFKGCFLYKPCC